MTGNILKSLNLIFVFAGLLPVSGSGGTESQFPIPPPKYKVHLERSVMVPMRDGIKLSTDLYFPQVADGEKLPVILVRTPYNKNDFRDEGADPSQSTPYFFAERGFIVAVQDCRGRFESEGEYVVSKADSEDGFDAVTWVATQSWANGNVGTIGCSYSGENQIESAKLKSPHLKAMIPQAAGGALGSGGNRYRFFGQVMGGVNELSAGFGWFYQYGSKIYFRPPAGLPRNVFLENAKFFDPAPKVPAIDFQKVWRSLPLIDLMKKVGAPPSDYEDFVSHDPADSWWDQFGYIKDTDRFNVPALHINSWYDFGVADTFYLFNLLRTNADSETARDNQFVIISPTTHCLSESSEEKTVAGEREVGDARFDYRGIYFRWFDFWLNGAQNNITKMPKVQIYVMGKNEWRAEDQWPLQRTQFTNFYFRSDSHANGRFGTGNLSEKAPGNEPYDEFVYDPQTPVPSKGGPVCCTGSPDAPAGSFDQSEIEMRQDVLVYTTPAPKQGTEVTGPIEVVLYVSSSAKDTDFTAKLVDVYPDGKAYNVQEGILRARYREGFDRKVWMKEGEVYRLKIDLQATSNFFGPGHQIRVEVSSSNFPRFDRNLNTGGNNFDETHWVVAKNRIHHSARYPSHIVLPVIK